MQRVGETTCIANGQPSGTGDHWRLVCERLADEPSCVGPVEILDEFEVGHELLDNIVLVGREVGFAHCLSGSVRGHVFGVLDIIAHCKSNAHHSLELEAEHLVQLLRAGNFITRDTGFGTVEQVRDHVH